MERGNHYLTPLPVSRQGSTRRMSTRGLPRLSALSLRGPQGSQGSRPKPNGSFHFPLNTPHLLVVLPRTGQWITLKKWPFIYNFFLLTKLSTTRKFKANVSSCFPWKWYFLWQELFWDHPGNFARITEMGGTSANSSSVFLTTLLYRNISGFCSLAQGTLLITKAPYEPIDWTLKYFSSSGRTSNSEKLYVKFWKQEKLKNYKLVQIHS